MRHYFLGMAAGYETAGWVEHLFTIGKKKDLDELTRFLAKKYNGEAILTKNGRSALTLALKAYFEPGDAVIVNGFTCYAVYEAVKAAGLVPIFADISKEDLNFDVDTLTNAADGHFEVVRDNGSEIASEPRDDGRERSGPKNGRPCVRGIIVQNTLGNPANIRAITKFAKEHELTIIEDLAHCAGVKYTDKRETGTVGAACVLSFGKDKSIDTISGGAVVFREPKKHDIKAPSNHPKLSDHLRARFYPMFGGMCRGLTYIGIGGAVMRGLVKIHWVERSADNKLDLTRRLSKFEAKLALKRLKDLKRNGEPPLRDFVFVRDRDELLKKLQAKGYYFSGFWYEKPVSPVRYYKKVHFPEKECPNAIYAAEHIINLPIYYSRRDLGPAMKIIKEYLDKTIDEAPKKEGKNE